MDKIVDQYTLPFPPKHLARIPVSQVVGAPNITIHSHLK